LTFQNNVRTIWFPNLCKHVKFPHLLINVLHAGDLSISPFSLRPWPVVEVINLLSWLVMWVMYKIHLTFPHLILASTPPILCSYPLPSNFPLTTKPQKKRGHFIFKSIHLLSGLIRG
jgi:hypothetical protein